MKLDEKYVFHIPLYKYSNNKLTRINIEKSMHELINQLGQNGYDSLYMTKAKGYFKSRSFDELLITIFVSSQNKLKEKSPECIFKEWFMENNVILEQEAFAYEYNNTLLINKLI